MLNSRAMSIARQSYATLHTTRTANAGRLAGAVKAVLAQDQGCVLQAVGPAAHSKALKAMVYATDFFEKDRPGLCVAADPRVHQVPADGGRPATTGIRFHLTLVPQLVVSEAMLIARKHLQLKDDEALLAIPLVQELESDSGQLKRTLLQCQRARAPKSALEA
ncbi:unnamed protein product [Durusdinium trenchii]|uniref:Uncharacterized protein n=2 Tax=Durusdinium trenchii TaxID=1381693 RepID=A0ABP0Q484_9DINO